MMNPRNCKHRGWKLQTEIAEMLHKKFPALTLGKDKDIQGREMGQSGTDIRLSEVAKVFIPFDIEAKFHEKLNIWSAIEQAESNTEKGRIPLVVFRRNRSKTYAVIEFSKLLYIME